MRALAPTALAASTKRATTVGALAGAACTDVIALAYDAAHVNIVHRAIDSRSAASRSQEDWNGEEA
jgi:hypothetical protein